MDKFEIQFSEKKPDSSKEFMENFPHKVIPETPLEKRKLPIERQLETLDQLVGQTTDKAVLYLVEQMLFEQIKVPIRYLQNQDFEENFFNFMFRFYRIDKKGKRSKDKDLTKNPFQPPFLMGLGDILNGTLDRFIQSRDLDNMYYNALALHNCIPVYKTPFFRSTPIDIVNLYFARTKAATSAPAYFDEAGGGGLRMLFMDFDIPCNEKNIKKLKDDFEKFFYHQSSPIPVEGVFIESPGHRIHFLTTNPLFNPQQYSNIKQVAHLLNDPHAEVPTIRLDVRHFETYDIARKRGHVPILEQVDSEKSTAFRLNGSLGQDHPVVVAVQKAPDPKWFDSYWETYNFTQSFEPEYD